MHHSFNDLVQLGSILAVPSKKICICGIRRPPPPQAQVSELQELQDAIRGRKCEVHVSAVLREWRDVHMPLVEGRGWRDVGGGPWVGGQYTDHLAQVSDFEIFILHVGTGNHIS